jgi:hypothetical protein
MLHRGRLREADELVELIYKYYPQLDSKYKGLGHEDFRPERV